MEVIGQLHGPTALTPENSPLVLVTEKVRLGPESVTTLWKGENPFLQPGI